MASRFLGALSFAASLACTASAQELVTNGDFANGLTGWTTAGIGLDPRIDTFRTDGVSTHACFTVLPGSQGTFVLSQTLSLPLPARYEVAVDLANLWLDPVTDYTGAVVSVWMDQTRILDHDFGRAGRAPDLRRARAFGVAMASGAVNLQVRVTSLSQAVLARSPRLFVDNVSVRLAPGPIFGFAGERRLGRFATYGVQTWLPSTPYALFVSPKLQSPPLKVPGWVGDWHLDPGSAAWLLGGVTNALGVAAGSLPIPDTVSLDGLALHWQALEIGGNGQVFGNATQQGFYAPLRSGGVIEETFASTEHRDALRDGAHWGGAATARFVGGSGALGDFDVRAGGVDTGLNDAVGRRIFEWSTDRTTIPGARTLSGRDVTVTNGVFEFTSFHLRENEHLRFTGSHVPVLKVTGVMRIDGALSQSGLDMVREKATQGGGPLDGQAGGRPGAGGGRGGKAGDSPAKAQPVLHGADGQDVQVPSGHPLAGHVAGTGGKGSQANPPSGLDQHISFSAYATTLCQQAAAGGGGGGFLVAGAGGSAFDNRRGLQDHPPRPADLGPPAAGGVAAPFQRVLDSVLPSHLRFLIGGSGGGGAGVHPHGANTFQIRWSSGGAGAGGGGPLHLKVGGELVVTQRGQILARGGAGHGLVGYDTLNYYNPSPGGAGAGGTILAQLGAAPSLQGIFDVRGGAAGILDGDGGATGLRLRVDCASGAGSDGFIRIEAAQPLDVGRLGSLQPPAAPENTGVLRAGDHDAQGLLATTWYEAPGQRFVRYEIDGTVGLQPIVFSDDPLRGLRASTGQPFVLLVQGAELDPITKQPKPNTLTPWHEGTVSLLNATRSNGLRFLLRFDRAAANTASLVVSRVRFFVE